MRGRRGPRAYVAYSPRLRPSETQVICRPRAGRCSPARQRATSCRPGRGSVVRGPAGRASASKRRLSVVRGVPGVRRLAEVAPALLLEVQAVVPGGLLDGGEGEIAV